MVNKDDAAHNYVRRQASSSKTESSAILSNIGAQQTRNIDPMFGYCWTSVADDGPTLTQHLFNDSFWLGERHYISGTNNVYYFNTRQQVYMEKVVEYFR